MTENLGTARIDIVVDTSNMEAAIQRAQNLTAGMSQQAQAEYAKLNAAEKRRVDSLLRQAETLGMTRQEQILFNAALKGVPTGVLDDLKRRLAGVGAQTQANTLSAKQMQQAIRGVPAQITDIFVSLQGGTNPLTVLLQQGGQLRDMFGGIGPAARALGSSLLGLINPITVTAAAVGVLAAAWHSAEKEQENFHKAIIQTGNFAGVTAAELAGMAAKLDAATSATRAKASAVLAEVTGTGRFTAQEIQLVTEAAIRMEAATGKAIEETVREFASLKGDPVEAILKLNETQHFLTASTLEQIESLKEQGRTADAAAIAIRAYADAINQRAPQIEAHLSTWTRLWRELKQGAVETFDEIQDKFRENEVTTERFIQNFAQSIRSLNPTIAATLGQFAQVYGIADRQREAAGRQPILIRGSSLPMSQAELDAREQRKKAEQEWNRFTEQNLSRREKQLAEERRLQELGKKLGLSQAEIDKQIAASRQRFQESLPKGRRTTDPGENILSRLQRQIALNQEQLRTEEKLTASDRLRVDVQHELERVGAKIPATTRARIEAALAELAVTGDKVEAFEREKKALEDLNRLKAQLAVAEQNQARALEIDLIALTRGGDAAERLRRQLDLQRELEDGLDRIKRDSAGKTQEALEAEEKALRESIEKRMQMEAGFWEQREKLMGDWRIGAQRAIDDFVAREQDTASRMYDIWSGAFVGLEDVLTDFFTKGKADWKGFFDSLAEEITRFIIRQQLTKWLSQVQFGMTGEGQAGGGWFNSLLQGFGSMMSGGWGGIAMGGAFGGGQRLDKFALGGVVNAPTLFQHGSRIGLMGEAGPEAIVPLHRGRDGKLGVKMAQPTAAPGPVALSQTFVIEGRLDSSTQEQLSRRAGREAARGLARTGR